MPKMDSRGIPARLCHFLADLREEFASLRRESGSQTFSKGTILEEEGYS